MPVEKRIFTAPSPKNGTIRSWQAIMELANAEVISIISKDGGEEEEYRKGSPEYIKLLAVYNKF
jgi:hypothetical protein